MWKEVYILAPLALAAFPACEGGTGYSGSSVDVGVDQEDTELVDTPEVAVETDGQVGPDTADASPADVPDGRPPGCDDAHSEGESCGVCDSGQFLCSDAEWQCEGDRGASAQNSCGGCEPLADALGHPCGACDTGTLTCDTPDSIACSGDDPDAENVCGGCESLDTEPELPCGTCDSGQTACDGPDNVICQGDRGADANNACGGCQILPGGIGNVCGPCGLDRTRCEGENDVACDGQTLCPEGHDCERDNDCDSGNCSHGTCTPEGFVYIQPGTFTMGSPPDEWSRDEDESPQHEVVLSRGYFLGVTEVTLEAWTTLMGTNPSAFPECDENCPVHNITWADAIAYSIAVSERDGFEPCYVMRGCTGTPGVDLDCGDVDFVGVACSGYRLPTEAEWEYAARAGTTSAHYNGELTGFDCPVPSLVPIAWHCRQAGNFPKPVGLKNPNPWGLLDMIGNIAEFTTTVYYAYEPGTERDPVHYSPVRESRFVLRGGSWTAAETHRSASRGGPLRRRRLTYAGLRIARTVTGD